MLVPIKHTISAQTARTSRPLILLFIICSFLSGTTINEYFLEIKPRFSGNPPKIAANLFSIFGTVKVFLST
jgi:hypothetical protein